jgi:hypothetical protein
MLLSAFLLGSHNGYIALWRENDPKPIRVFPYKVSSLPLADQILLKRGIRLDRTEDLAKLAEDYMS